MSIELIGMIGGRNESEVVPATGPIFDPAFTTRFARAHEGAGFDRVLIGYFGHGPDGFGIAYTALAATERLGVLLAHRPGFVSPPLAARKLATLDQFAGGRAAVHIISGGSDADQARDGDWTDHAGRYRRTDEYLDALKAVWTAEEPVDHDGEFYRFAGAHSEVRCLQRPHLPIFFGGSSDAAVRVAGKHADTYMLWGEPLDATAEHVERVRASAAARGREVRFSVSTRPILGPTEAAAWRRAHAIHEQIQRGSSSTPAATPENIGSQRLLRAAAGGELHDRCLWTPLAAATGAPGNSTALVGTPETVARALLDYHDLGIDVFLIRGYDPFADAVEYGRELIPLVRKLTGQREPAPIAS